LGEPRRSTNARAVKADKAGTFRRRFDGLILLAWTVLPVFGLSFLLCIHVFTPEQMISIISTPVEPASVAASLIGG